MAFHNVRLNTDISRGAVGGPRSSTIIQTTASGHETRITRQANDRRAFEFSKDLLAAQDWSELLDFFAHRHGHLHSFRFKDWSDYTTAIDGRAAPDAEDQIIGTGDGTTTTFQLFKTRDPSGINPRPRAITLPVVDTVVAALDGSPTISFSISDPGGVITFGTAPGAGVVVTAGCEFDVPVRFDLPQEQAEIELTHAILSSWRRMGCVEVLDEVATPELWYPGGSSGPIVLNGDYAVNFSTELWTFETTVAANIFLPAPDRLPGGPRILTIHNLSTSTSTLQVRDDAGNAVGSTFGAGATKRLLLSRSGSTATWILA